MKIKGILAVSLAALISFGAGLGTLAFYQSTFSSSGDFEAEEWDVSASGIEAGMEFEKTFSNLELAPGRATGSSFIIRRNNTDVNYVIKVLVETDGDLFEPVGTIQSPVLVKLGTGSATPMPVTPGVETIVTNTNTANIAANSFTLNVVWPWETPNFVGPDGNSYDNLWANKLGEVTVKVVVVQEQEFGTPATMRLRIKTTDAAYQLVAPILGASGDIDTLIIGRMEVDTTASDKNNYQVTFKANDARLGVIELNNRNLNFVTLNHQTNLPSNYDFGKEHDVLVAKTSNNIKLELNFID